MKKITLRPKLERQLLPNERNNNKLTLTLKELRTINTALLNYNEDLTLQCDERNEEMIKNTKTLFEKTMQLYENTNKQEKRTEVNKKCK